MFLQVGLGYFKHLTTSLALQCAKAFVHVHLKNKNPTTARSVGIKSSCFLGKDQLLGFLLRCWVGTQISVHRTSMNHRARFYSPKPKLQKIRNPLKSSAVFSRSVGTLTSRWRRIVTRFNQVQSKMAGWVVIYSSSLSSPHSGTPSLWLFAGAWWFRAKSEDYLYAFFSMILLSTPPAAVHAGQEEDLQKRPAQRGCVCVAACASSRFGTSLPASGAQKPRTGGAHS